MADFIAKTDLPMFFSKRELSKKDLDNVVDVFRDAINYLARNYNTYDNDIAALNLKVLDIDNNEALISQNLNYIEENELAITGLATRVSAIETTGWVTQLQHTQLLNFATDIRSAFDTFTASGPYLAMNVYDTNDNAKVDVAEQLDSADGLIGIDTINGYLGVRGNMNLGSNTLFVDNITTTETADWNTGIEISDYDLVMYGGRINLQAYNYWDVGVGDNAEINMQDGYLVLSTQSNNQGEQTEINHFQGYINATATHGISLYVDNFAYLNITPDKVETNILRLADTTPYKFVPEKHELGDIYLNDDFHIMHVVDVVGGTDYQHKELGYDIGLKVASNLADLSPNLPKFTIGYLNATDYALQYPAILVASNDIEGIEAQTFVITRNILPPRGLVESTIRGKVDGMDTTAYADDDILYLGTNGTMTNVKPTPPTPVIILGKVLKVHATNGEIYFSPRVVDSLESLSDTFVVGSLTEGDIFRFNGTNSRFESYNIDTAISTAIANLVDSSPATLDTLNELAAALGDDPNFATTVTNQIAGVQTNLDTHTSDTANPHQVSRTQLSVYSIAEIDTLLTGYEPTHSHPYLSNTLQVILEGDSRLTDARNPLAHTHLQADITDLDKYTQAEVDALLTGYEPTHSHPYLPLVGGVITGDVTFNDGTASSPELKFQNQSFIAGIDFFNNTQQLRFIDRTNNVSRIEMNLSASPNITVGGQQVVLTNDSRLSDARTPLAHNQAWSTITSTPTTLAGYGITDADTSSEIDTKISTALASLVDSSPGTLDTLNELAAALGDDPNFATTVTDSIATKLPLAGGIMTGNINMEDETIDFKTNGSLALPQILGMRGGGDLDARAFENEGGFSYTTFDANSTNDPTGITNNANGLITINTHIGAYGHQLAFTNVGDLWHRSRDGVSFTSWERLLTSVNYNSYALPLVGGALTGTLTIKSDAGSFGDPSTEAGYRLKFYDNGGVNNDAGIGLDGTAAGGETMWFNALNGFYWNDGTGGKTMTLTGDGKLGIGTDSPDSLLHVNGTGRVATIGGDPAGVPNAAIATQTSYLELVAGTGGGTNSSGLIFHNPGISTAVLEYVNTTTNDGYFNLKSDDSSFAGLKISSNEVWHAGNLDPTDYLPLAGGAMAGDIAIGANEITFQENHVINRRFEMIENASPQYILLCVNAANNDVNGRITMDRTSGNYQAVVLDVIVSSGTSGMYGGTLKTLQLLQSSEDYHLVTVTYNTVSYVAIRYTGNTYPETTGVYFTGRIVSTGLSLTVVTNVTDVVTIGGNSEAYYQVSDMIITGNKVLHEGNYATIIGTGNSALVPAAGSAGQFLAHDGTWGVPAGGTDTNNYLTGVSGTGNGTVTFTREGLTDLTWDASHSHTITDLNPSDSRNVVTTPETTNKTFTTDFKANTTEGLSDGGSYFGEITFRPYGSSTTDWSGGPAHQLGFTENGNIWHRYGSSTTWGAWKTLLDSSNFEPLVDTYDVLPTYSADNEDFIKYNLTEHCIEIQSDTDTSFGGVFPAFRVDQGTTYRISVSLKSDVISTDGVYIRPQEYDAELPDDKTHVAGSATHAKVQEATRQITSVYENNAVGTTWKQHTFIYTPTSTTKWASIMFLNWSGLANYSLYIKNLQIRAINTTGDNDYIDGISFNTADGILTLTRTGTLDDLTVDLDGRYLLDNGTWTGGTGSPYTILAGSFKATGNTKFTFYGDSGKMDVITDGEFYANEGSYKVLHENNFDTIITDLSLNSLTVDNINIDGNTIDTRSGAAKNLYLKSGHNSSFTLEANDTAAYTLTINAFNNGTGVATTLVKGNILSLEADDDMYIDVGTNIITIEVDTGDMIDLSFPIVSGTKTVTFPNDTCTLLGTKDVDDTPINGATTAPVSSNWAYDHANANNPHNLTYTDVGAAASSHSHTIYAYNLNNGDYVRIGTSASADATEAIAIGYNSNADYDRAIAIGQNATTGSTADAAIAIGYAATAPNSKGIAIGQQANCDSNNGIAIGYGADAGTDAGAIAIGQSAYAQSTYGIAIGRSAAVAGVGSDYSIAIGYSAYTSTSKQVRIGDTSSLYYTTLYSRVDLTVSSDERDKTNIEPIDKSLEFLNEITPITYVDNPRDNYMKSYEEMSDEEKAIWDKYEYADYDKDAHAKGLKASTRNKSGVSAQETFAAIKKVYGTDNYGGIVNDNFFEKNNIPEGVENRYTVTYVKFIPFLIDGVNRLNKKLQKEKKRNDNLIELLVSKGVITKEEGEKL